MADEVKQMLAKPIQLADQLAKLADDAHLFKQECAQLKPKVELLSGLLCKAARAVVYEQPTQCIVDETETVLDKALSLVSKCHHHGLVNAMIIIIPADAFKKITSLLENSIGDVSWLLRVSSANRDNDGDEQLLGLPPIASTEPILSFIWEQIAKLHTGSIDERSDAAASLVSLAEDSKRYGKLIIEEGGVGPLLKSVKEGQVEGQENAARAIGLLGRGAESVEHLEHLLHAGVCTVFTGVLKEGPMKVQAMVAWAISELAANYSGCQDLFAHNRSCHEENVIGLLIGHLAFETVQEHSKYSGMSSILTNKRRSTDPDVKQNQWNRNQLIQSTIAATESSKLQSNPNGIGVNGREIDDPATQARLKAMAAKALCELAKGNSAICRSITESNALLCFALLLEKGTAEVQLNSAMALMEIARVAEQDAVFRRLAFKANSPFAKAVIGQLVRIVDKADDDDLLVPCITTLGCLSRTFRATETRIIGPLVRLMVEREEGVVLREVLIALTKFSCTDNNLALDHSKAIITAGGVQATEHVVQLAYFGEKLVQIPSLVLLCYITIHLPNSEEFAQVEVPKVLEWYFRRKGLKVKDPLIHSLLSKALNRLQLYHS